MKAYEYLANVLPDGHLSLPDDLRDKLKSESRVRVMLLVEEEDSEWDDLTMGQFFKGYSDMDAIYDTL